MDLDLESDGEGKGEQSMCWEREDIPPLTAEWQQCCRQSDELPPQSDELQSDQMACEIPPQGECMEQARRLAERLMATSFHIGKPVGGCVRPKTTEARLNRSPWGFDDLHTGRPSHEQPEIHRRPLETNPPKGAPPFGASCAIILAGTNQCFTGRDQDLRQSSQRPSNLGWLLVGWFVLVLM
eukprot:c6243_g1_i1 orf=397-942(-)